MFYRARKYLEAALLWVAFILVLSFAFSVIVPNFLRAKLEASGKNFRVRFERICKRIIRYLESEPFAYRM